MKTPQELGITQEQFSNFLQLAKYLANEANFPTGVSFDMECYSKDPYIEINHNPPNCGAIGCAIGHGPYAGVKIRDNEGYPEYCDRVFCSLEKPLWDWCFNSDWSEVDNTSNGASKRIIWALEKGVPSDSFLQMTGNAPLCYK